MSPRRTFATSLRVLRQLRHDPRTLGLIFFVPCILLILVKYIFEGQSQVFNSFAPLVLGIFPLTIMFLVTSIATLRERTAGTLDRLMTMPLSRADFVVGYGLAFSMVALIQALLASWVVLGLLQVPVGAGTLPVVIGAVLAALLGTSLGLLLSAFASTEFQAVQFLPAVIFPQLLTCGLFVPRNQMAAWLQRFSDVLPMTYSVDAMKHIISATGWTATIVRDLGIVAGFTVAALLLGAVTIRRKD